MAKNFGSIGLYRNEAEECVNSEHKRHLDKHSATGGWGTSMAYDVMLFSLRKLYKQYEECDWMNLKISLKVALGMCRGRI